VKHILPAIHESHYHPLDRYSAHLLEFHEYRIHTLGLPGTEMSIQFDNFKIHITTEIIR
jgi:hypothetical protein